MSIDQDDNAIFFYKTPRDISDFSEQIHTALVENGVKYIDEVEGSLRNYKENILNLCENGGCFGFDNSWINGYIDFYHPKKAGYLGGKLYNYYSTFKNHFVIAIYFDSQTLTEDEDDFISKLELLLEFVRSFFIKTRGKYAIFPNRYPTHEEYYPNENDIKKNWIASWTTINLFSREYHNKISPSYRLTNDGFTVLEHSDGVVEYIEKDYKKFGYGGIFISNEKFINKRLMEIRNKKNITDEEIEERIAYWRKASKNYTGDGSWELKTLGVSKERIEQHLREVVEFKIEGYEKRGTAIFLAEAGYIYRHLGDKKGTIRVAELWFKTFERSNENPDLKAVFDVLNMGNVSLDYVKKYRRDFYNKLIKFQKLYEEEIKGSKDYY